MTESDWDKARGVTCKDCGREVFRIPDGLCLECWEKAHEFEVRDKAGALSLLPMDVIKQIVHPTKKDKSSGVT
jgi:hypothetical protein